MKNRRQLKLPPALFQARELYITGDSVLPTVVTSICAILPRARTYAPKSRARHSPNFKGRLFSVSPGMQTTRYSSGAGRRLISFLDFEK